MKRVLLAAASGIGLGAALVLRSSLRVPTFDLGSRDASPHLLCALPDPLLLLLAGGAGGLLGGLLGFRGKAHLATPFLPAWLAVAVFLPGVFSAAPFLAAFAGRFLDLVLFSCLLVALGRHLSRAVARPAPVVLVSVGAFAIYAVVGLWISRKVGLSGDEPHYLLVTYSLLHDRDLEVQDNYADEDYRHFYGGTIGAHLGEGTRYSVHGVGVSLLLLPGFALGGLAGVTVTEALVAALLLGAIYALAFELTGSGKAALFAAAAFGLTSPALFLSVSAYPELPAALVVTFVARRLVREDVPGARAALFWTLLLGTLPFFHVKFAPLAAILFAALVLRFGLRRGPSLKGLIAGATLSFMAFLFFSFWTAGSFDPTASYGRQRVFLDRIPLGAAGLLFDQEFGLLPSSPVYLLGLAALASLFRRKRILGVVAVLAFLAVLIPSAAHPLWTGGSSPAARFLFPGLPLLMAAAACLVAREEEVGIGPWAPSLLATSLALSSALLFLPGGPWYLNARDGRGQVWEALSSSWDLTDYFPSLVEADPRSLLVAAGLGLVVLAAIAAQARLVRLRLPAFALILLLGAWAQDLTGVARSRDLEGSWTLEAMRDLEGRDAFMALPSFERLSRERITDALSLPLDADPMESDPTSWWSSAYSIPAGRFEVSGIESSAIELCNGEGCFSKGDASFSSNVALRRFRVRAFSLPAAPRLRMREPRPARAEAQRTIAFDGGSRLHGLDDAAHLDPSGFWVRKSSRASFALEIVGSGESPPALRLRNGGVENRVEVEGPRNQMDFTLHPWEAREVLIEGDGPVVLFSLESASGFRPSDLDPGSRDRRELGVLIRAEPAFD